MDEVKENMRDAIKLIWKASSKLDAALSEIKPMEDFKGKGLIELLIQQSKRKISQISTDIGSLESQL